MTADLSKNCIFAKFKFLHIPNGQILHFKCPLVMVFLILGGFPESRKKKNKFFMTAALSKKCDFY